MNVPSVSPLSQQDSGAPGSAKRSSARALWISLALVFLALISLVALGLKTVFYPNLPVLGQAPSFQFTNQQNETVTNASLNHQVWIVNFSYLSCKSSCPKLLARMAETQALIQKEPRLSERTSGKLPIRMLSMSVDPENDTPDKLQVAAKKYGANADLWWFVTGKNEELDRIIVDGFKIHYQKADPKTNMLEIMHGDWFVLVDKSGKIRGYYETSDQSKLQKLVQDAVRLTKESK